MSKIAEKSLELAIEIAPIVLRMQRRKEFKLSDQIKRSSTSVALNWSESQTAESKSMWRHKVNIALGEAKETLTAIKIIHAYKYIDDDEFKKLNDICDHLVAMLTKCLKTASR